MTEQQPEKSSLLHKVLRNNLLIIGFFVALIWIYATVTACQGVYRAELSKKQEILSEYTVEAKKIINSATIHSEQIAKSTYIIQHLKTEPAGMDEMLEFFDYANELVSSTVANSGRIKIYHNNAAITESQFFSHTEKLPDYHTILAKLKKNNVIFDDAVFHLDIGFGIKMYRLMPWNSGCVLEYPIVFDIENNASYPMEIVSASNHLLNDKAFFHEEINPYFYAVMKIPRGELFRSVLPVLLLCFLVLGLLVALMMYLSKRTAKKTLREINDFLENITGESLLYDSKLIYSTYDLYELNLLRKTLQNLATEIQTYAEAVKNAELENKELEMELLSMQLDPHMLYNSLASIRLDAYRIKHQKIIDLVDNMVLYYRDILKKDRKFITVEQEIESIRKYLYINELSHEKKYHLETVIDEELKKMQIPPQILHTFVENCIVHGLSGINRDCVIRIKMRESDGFIITEIYDNGYGIATEKLDQINAGTLGPRHIGISNALKRLKLVYGEASSIHYDSEKNAYTKFIIRFPKTDQPL